MIVNLDHGAPAMIDNEADWLKTETETPQPLLLVKPSMLLWLSDSRGQYIPRDFADSFSDRAKNVSGVSEDEWELLEAGPDMAWHWETWDNVLNNAVVTDDAGVKFRLHQDGDLWLVPEGMEWSDETQTFEWPDSSEGEDATPG